jgi:hypothetical protein
VSAVAEIHQGSIRLTDRFDDPDFPGLKVTISIPAYHPGRNSLKGTQSPAGEDSGERASPGNL